jgi:hypothetical protein
MTMKLKALALDIADKRRRRPRKRALHCRRCFCHRHGGSGQEHVTHALGRVAIGGRLPVAWEGVIQIRTEGIKTYTRRVDCAPVLAIDDADRLKSISAAP